MFGAYWCSHCYGQKQQFGAAATKLIEYVECAEDGYQSQRSMCQKTQIKLRKYKEASQLSFFDWSILATYRVQLGSLRKLFLFLFLFLPLFQ